MATFGIFLFLYYFGGELEKDTLHVQDLWWQKGRPSPSLNTAGKMGEGEKKCRLVRVRRSGKTWPASESHGQISPCWVQGQVWWAKAGQLGRIGHILSDWLAARGRRHATSESVELFRDKFNEVEDNVRMHR